MSGRLVNTIAKSLTTLSLVIVSAAVASSADPTPQEALSKSISPVQKSVRYSKVAEQDIKDCTVESVKEDSWAGWYVLGPSGQRLRRFADTNNDKAIDLWCYYLGGVEVYRDIDSNYNGKADQYRWLGTAGSRWGVDGNEDGKIDQWKRISAEEVTQELVQAVATQDSDRFVTLLLNEQESKGLGLSGELAEKLGPQLRDAKDGFAKFASEQQKIKADSKWAHFVASQPGAIPSSLTGDEQDDLLVYENVVAMFDTGAENGQLYVGTLVQVGKAWRLIDVPKIVEGNDGLAQNIGFFFSNPTAASAVNAAASQMNENTQKLVTQLETIEQRLSKASASEKPRLHEEQANVLKSLISNSTDPKETTMWIRQMTESVSAAIHSGEFNKGLDYLDLLRRSIRGRSKTLAAFVEFEYINAEYGLQLQRPDANFAEVQEAKIKALTEFVAEYPDAEESARAMMDLALSKEFENEDKAAGTWYQKVIDQFPGLPEAKKAEGAIRRLDAIGKTIPLTGKTIDGRAFDLSRYRGRPVIVHYWATWCESCKQDMKLYRKLQAQYAKDSLMVIGVNVDTQKSAAQNYLKANASVVNWPQLFAEGGLESSALANILGVQTLPTTLVIDKEGRVAKTNVLSTELEDEIKRIVR